MIPPRAGVDTVAPWAEGDILRIVRSTAWWATRIVETARCGVIQLDFPGYMFPSLNRLMRLHWSDRAEAGRRAKDFVAIAARLAEAPVARGRRRVSMAIAKPRGRLRDADNCWKLALDALVANQLLIDDSPQFCVLGEVTQTRGLLKTVITLEDITDG